MKTVGEFKKAGLVFVNGDVYCHKGSTLKMLADGITLRWFELDAKALNATIIGFAWRENTGVKPKFSGFIDFTHKDGTEYFSQKVGSRHCSEWGIVGGANQIAKWRPSLNQPSLSVESDTKQSAEEKRMDIIENGNDGLHYDNTAQQVEALAMKQPSEKMKVALKEADDISGGFITRCLVFKPADKPIFTQAMADAGTLPPVGSLFIDIEYNENKQVLALAHHLGKVVYAADYDDVSQVDYFHADQDECKPIYMRTERDKAIDAAMNEWPAADKSTLEVAYDFWRVGEKC